MARFFAFLRAINVGGHIVTMDRLRQLFQKLELKNVETFIASGNVVFTSAARDAGALESRIEAHLAKRLGYEVRTFLRSEAELCAVAQHRPFSEAQLRSHSTLNVGFLAQPLTAAEQKTVLGFNTESDAFHVSGREVYWLTKGRQSDSTFSYAVLEKALKQRATFRNITTINRLAAKYKLTRD